MEKLQFNATVDGKTFEKTPTQYLKDGDYHKIPYIMGHNSTEGAGVYLQFLGYPETKITEKVARESLPFHVGKFTVLLRKTFEILIPF